jgi:SnoaL-like domain
MTDPGLDPRIRETLDRQRLAETVTRMFVHTDRREWEALEGLFTETVTIDWTSLSGGEPVTLQAAQLVTGWRDALGGFRATQHLIGNLLIEVLDGERAVVSCYGVATHVLPTELAASHWRVAGAYRFELQRHGDDWRIAAATFTALWGDGNKELLALAALGDR